MLILQYKCQKKMDSKLQVVPLGMRLYGFGKSVQNGETFHMFFKEEIGKLVVLPILKT